MSTAGLAHLDPDLSPSAKGSAWRLGQPIVLSPTTGQPLRLEGSHVLTDGRERWPMIDGIPYLRTGREPLVAAALACLDRGDMDGALVHILADQDDWWDGPAPSEADLRALLEGRNSLTLRDAMGLLAYGRVGDYFAHRWSDPTYLAGLALIDAHWAEPSDAFELACGIGHYLRELHLHGVRVTGADVVFSKLWLARHWVVGPEAELVCFDARSPWPVADRRFDLVLCKDAFYFLEPKAEILARLRGLAGEVLVVGHIHNREAENLSAGSGVTAAEIAAMFPDATVYDDAELTRAARDGRAPRPRPPAELRDVEAFALVEGGETPPRPADGPLCRVPSGALPRRNPLYDGSGEIRWPSPRYRDEYAPRATYPARTELPETVGAAGWTLDHARRREVLDLPARW